MSSSPPHGQWLLAILSEFRGYDAMVKTASKENIWGSYRVLIYKALLGCICGVVDRGSYDAAQCRAGGGVVLSVLRRGAPA